MINYQLFKEIEGRCSKEKMNKKPAERVRDDVIREPDLNTPLLSDPDFGDIDTDSINFDK